MDRWRALLEQASSLGEDERGDFVSAHPELLAESVQRSLEEGLSQTDSPEVRQTLAELRTYREAIEARTTQYVTDGPLEGLWARLMEGELAAATAYALARESWEATLADVYLRGLSGVARQLSESGALEPALMLQRILIEAMDARPDGLAGGPASHYACYRYVIIAALYLREMPDGRVFRHADGVGRRVLEDARAKADTSAQAEALSALGTLHQAPYTSGRRSTGSADELYRWQQTFVDRAGDTLLGVDPEEWNMPPPRDALREAFDLLTECAELSSGTDRGVALKQAIEAAFFNQALGEAVDEDRLLALAREALDVLDPDESPTDYLSVINAVDLLGGEVTSERVEEVLRASPDEWVRRLNRLAAIDIFRQASAHFRKSDRRRSVEVLRQIRPLVKVLGDEEIQRQVWLDELNVIDNPGDTTPDSAAGFEAAAAEARARAEEENWDVADLAGRLLWLAATCSKVDAEPFGLALLDEVSEIAPAFATEHGEALALQRAMLHLNHGVTGVDADDVDTALSPYLEALQRFTALGMNRQALDALRRIDDLARSSGPEGTITIVVGLIGIALRLENALGDPATRYIQQICKRALARMALGQVNPEALLFLMQLAKGLRFAVQLGSGAAYEWSETPEGQRLLDEIAALEAQLPEEQAPEPDPSLLEGLLVSPYSAEATENGGADTAMAQLTNLRRRYDRDLNARLHTGDGVPLFLHQELVQSSLDERTVLLSQHLGVTADGNMAVTTVAVSDDDMRVMVVNVNFPESQLQLTEGDRTYTTSGFGLLVQQLRVALAEPPDPLVLTSEAKETLDAPEQWFGDLLPALDEMRKRGKDHLCIVPHGPLHAFPYHLLHYEGAPLAERWAVTYLPNMRLLMSRPGPPTMRTRRRAPASVLALDYADGRPHGLTPLPEARAEAEAVARVHGVEPLLNERVTETAVKRALVGSRVVHVAAHGQHDIEAPAFQCLYVTPDEGSDGRLCAHELLALDLRATEVLTLSACETALGRFDLADNPRGLPATLLLAGVSTIVGTLWEVETNASAFFFSRFHQALHDGMPRLDAFTAAQRQTRESFSAYKDWGAFYFIGDWLEPEQSAV